MQTLYKEKSKQYSELKLELEEVKAERERLKMALVVKEDMISKEDILWKQARNTLDTDLEDTCFERLQEVFGGILNITDTAEQNTNVTETDQRILEYIEGAHVKGTALDHH